MADFWRQLHQRRVPQFLGLYLGASWAAIQFVDWLVERYLLSRHLPDIVLITLLSLIPAVLLIAYEHGAPGRQPAGRAGKIGVPANAVISVVLVALFLQGRDLEAAAKRVTVTDEDGQQVTRLVPTASALRKVILFFWANDSGDPDLDWLRYALPFVVERDLEQNRFVDGWSPYLRGLFTRLRRAGYRDGLGVPVALQRQMAADWRRGFFLDGRFDRHDDGLVARVAVYSTEGGGPVAELEIVGGDLFEVADLLTPRLFEALDVRTAGGRVDQDLPVTDILTADEGALRTFIAGENTLLLDNDATAAVALYERATEADPSFALAQSVRGNHLTSLGATARAREAIDAALRHDYRLTEHDRFWVKGFKYVLDEQPEKRLALFEM